MKFTKIASALLLAGAALAQQNNSGGTCGDYMGCDRTKVPQQELSGDIKLVATNDKFDKNVHYKVGGKVIITNDCEFRVENFYMWPAPKNPVRWSGTSSVLYTGTVLSNDAVQAVESPSATPLTYDVQNTNEFCKVALINEVSRFTLMEADTWQVIGYADIANSPAGPPPGAGSTGSTGSTTPSNPSSSNNTPSSAAASSTPAATSSGNSTQANSPSSSDATTSKWTMGLLALSSAVAYLLA